MQLEVDRVGQSVSELAVEQNAIKAEIRDRAYRPPVITLELTSSPEYAGELLTPCGLTAKQIESGLLDGLKPYATHFIQSEQDTGVNALFLAALAALESGWGESDVADSKNNLYGWTADDGGYMEFVSKEDCIAYVASQIKEMYLSPDGRYFNGYTVEDVNALYNGRDEWPIKVRQIMDDIKERSSENAGR